MWPPKWLPFELPIPSQRKDLEAEEDEEPLAEDIMWTNDLLDPPRLSDSGPKLLRDGEMVQ